ncbi:MAG: glycerophosphodiester phosphodiesterase [Gemmatimonadaceae bacterium]
MASHPHFELIGHRGAPRERVENTLPGFLLALERGADAVELDVHVSEDGEVVVHHDHEVRGRRIASSSWADLSGVDIGGATIPRLADVLEAVADRATVYIELKGVHIERAVLRVAEKHGRRYALHSFDHDAIERVKGLQPDVARGILLDRETPRAGEVMRAAVERMRPRDVWPHWSLVDAAFMAAARALELRVIPWTVNSKDTARDLANLNVDGICTDDVRVLTNLS